MPVTIGEFEVVAGSEPSARDSAAKPEAKQPPLSEREFRALARKRRARELRTRAS